MSVSEKSAKLSEIISSAKLSDEAFVAAALDIVPPAVLQAGASALASQSVSGQRLSVSQIRRIAHAYDADPRLTTLLLGWVQSAHEPRSWLDVLFPHRAIASHILKDQYRVPEDLEGLCALALARSVSNS